MMRRIWFFMLIPCLCLKAQPYNQNWEKLGPEQFPSFSGNGPCASGMGLVNALYVHPSDPSFILAGSNTGGLFRTKNAGLTWENVTDSSLPFVAGIGCIVADPFYPGRLFIGTGTTSFNRNYGLGVWRSDDWGDSWRPTALSFDPEHPKGRKATVKKILIHPVKANHLFALIREGSHALIYRTTDGGQHWEEIHKAQAEVFYDAEFDPGDPETIYVGGKSFWISRDGGDSWSAHPMNASPGALIHRIAIAVHPQLPGKVWTLYETSSQPGILISFSADHGQTFHQRSSHSQWKLDVGEWKMEFDVSKLDTSVLYVGGVFMHKSIDGGKNFQRISSNIYSSSNWMHVDARAMQVLAGDQNDIIYVGHDGGVSVSIDDGKNWKDISGHGLSITQFWGMALDHKNKRVLGGTQDLGALFWEQGSWWNAGIYGDAYDAMFHLQNPDTIVLLTHSGSAGAWRSKDGGKKWDYAIIPGIHGRNNRPLATHPVHSNILYAGYNDIYVSHDFGKAWDRLSYFNRDFGVRITEGLVDIALAASEPSWLYAAYGEPCWSDHSANKLFRSKDNGETWEDISTNLPGTTWTGITSLAVNPENAREIWVGFDRFWMDDSGINYKVFHSPDGGKHWKNQSQGLRNLPVNSLLILRRHQLLIAGTDAGVYCKPLHKGDWKPLGTDIPATIISDLETDPEETALYASTFGRGLYVLKLPEAKPLRNQVRKRVFPWFHFGRKRE